MAGSRRHDDHERGISWHSGNWSLYGGGFGGRFFSPFNPSPGITAGANVQVEYQPTDWLKLKGWGQYAYYADEYNNPHMLSNPFLYHTQVGGSMEFKVTDNFGWEPVSTMNTTRYDGKWNHSS